MKWLVQAGGPFDDNAQGVAVTPDQTGVIVVGYFSENARFTGPNGASEGLVIDLVASGTGTNVEAFIARYNHDGTAVAVLLAGCHHPLGCAAMRVYPPPPLRAHARARPCACLPMCWADGALEWAYAAGGKHVHIGRGATRCVLEPHPYR